MPHEKGVLIVVENNFVPLDLRVWNEARALRDNGWHVCVICPMPTGSFSDAELVANQRVNREGIAIYYFPLPFAERGARQYVAEYVTAYLAIMRLSWAAWRTEHFHIIHFCNPPDIFFLIARFYRLFGVRTIFDQHDLFPELVAHRFSGISGRLLTAFARVTEYLTYRGADVVLSTSESYRHIALQRGRVPEDRVVVVRNGPIAGDFKPLEPVATLKRGFRFMACYAGVMGQEDGLQEAAASIRHIVCDLHRHDILFALLGDGAVRRLVLEKFEAWGIAEFVYAPGMLSDRHLLRQYLSTADVCLSPEPLTPLNERSAFIKVSEYMAMAKPVVAFDLTETRYTAQDAAVYVQPGNTAAFGDAIVALVDDPERREYMGQFGRERLVNALSWELQQQNLIRAYDMALMI